MSEKKLKEKLNSLSSKEIKFLYTQAYEKEKRKLANENYAFYLSYILGENYTHTKHTKLLTDRLQRIADGEKNARIMISMPPRHSKSETCSKHFPSYYLGKNPNNEIILVTYGSALSEDFSRIAREDFKEFGEELFNLKLSSSKQNVSRWELEGCRGGCTAVGVGGSIYGRGCSLIIADDLLKGYEQAGSNSIKEGIWAWYRSVLRTRLTPDGSIIIIMTRWTTDDICGRLIEEEKHNGEKWEVISLPAISNGDGDPLNRPEGEPLWPERFNLETLDAIKRAIGTISWNTLYQQNPVPFGDIIFNTDWLQYYNDEDIIYNPQDGSYYFKGEPIIARYASCDPAVKTEEINDYTAVIVADITRSKNIIIRKILRKKINIPDQLKLVVNVNSIWKPTKFFIEDVGYQIAIKDVILSQGNYVPFVTITRGGKSNKEIRISEMSPMFENGKVYIKEDMDDFIDEYKLFPSSRHDDILDAMEVIFSKVRDLPNFGKSLLSGGINKIYQEEVKVPKSEVKFKYYDFMQTRNYNFSEIHKNNSFGKYFKF